MIFTTPFLLLALAGLPLLWWLLRATPPAPRLQEFPAIRLLAGLRRTEETPSRTPLWLLLLRMAAAALVIAGLAGPVLNADRGVLPGGGPVLLVVDDGWASAADWPQRLAAAGRVLDRAERAGRPVSLLATARDDADAAPRATAATPVAELRPRLAALRPHAWPVDRAAATEALAAAGTPGAVVYLSDGLAAPGDDAFRRALEHAGPVTTLSRAAPDIRLMLPPRAEADRLVARVALLPQPRETRLAVLAEAGDGRALARAEAIVPAGAALAEIPVALPVELRNQLTRLVLQGPPAAAGVVLLDERFRRRPVGLVTAGTGAETPLTGTLFYLDRALAPVSELRRGDLATLLGRDVSVLVMADGEVSAADAKLLRPWIAKGGLLLRFAGPRLAAADTSGAPDAAAPDAMDPAERPPAPGDAAAPDARLLPVPLLAGDRQLGGAMSWSQPEGLAPFPADSPFAGLPVPAEVTVTRQVLAEPGAALSQHTWARLSDGTPLVTERTLGRGRIVLFHVTANAEWSNLPLSGLFVDMLDRLVQLAAGVAPADDATRLAPAETLDGAGVLGPPPPAATGLAGQDFPTTPVSPRHPPGLYGPENDRRSLNLANALDAPANAPVPLPGTPPAAPALRDAGRGPGTVLPLVAAGRERPLGPWLLAAATALLALDLVLGLRLRGLLGRAAAAALLAAALLAAPARARTAPPAPAPVSVPARAIPAQASVPATPRGNLFPGQTPLGAAPEQSPALATHLAYVLTDDAQIDDTSLQGLSGLS
ncbi:MAG: BatA domain-containing protein, partial [Janthinobacterium lividum]